MIDSTQHQSIIESLKTWDRSVTEHRVTEANRLREQFVELFPIAAWPTLPLESYGLGQGTESTVSYWLEFKTKPVASMSGGSSLKHLIWKGAEGIWRYSKEYASKEEAWHAVRQGFVEVTTLASLGQFDDTDDVRVLTGAQAARMKLLYLYFPTHFVPVTSKAAIDHFLHTLGELPAPSVARANRQLLGALRAIPELASLSTQELGYFIYHWSDPRTSMRVVKIAPGERAKYWDDCLHNGYICVGWDDLGDLTQYDSKEAFREAFRVHYPYNGSESQVTRKSNELWTFGELQPGDTVIANRGISEILAVGTVNDSGYAWRPDRQTLKHTLGVDWDTTAARTIQPVKAWGTTTLSKVPGTLLRDILGAAPTKRAVEPDRIYLELESALQRRGQAVLYGPPGTGKTYVARRAAVWLLDGGSSSDRATAMLSDDAGLLRREAQLSSRRAPSRQVWFVVANPAQWTWNDLFSSGSIDYTFGRLQRNYPRVRAGDLVIGYESKPVKRITALARVTGEYDPDESPFITLEPVTPLDDGLTYEQLQADPALSQSEPLTNRCQGTLFALSPVEADHMLAQLADRDPRVTSVVEPSVQRLTRITFHPSYAYEDFIEGFRPKQSAGNTLDLVLVDGAFKRVCDAARADPHTRYIVLIDEINRGNIPKIFGELITLIEKDKRGMTVQLPQSGVSFDVPANVLIIGTMNTADRSVHLLDTALRRRFTFMELLPDSDLLEGATAGALALDVFLDGLNEEIRRRFGREKQIGHAMFFEGAKIVDTPEAFSAMFRFELLPLLQEYLYEDYRELAHLLGDVIDADTERIAADVVDDPDALCAKLANKFGASASV